MGYVLPIQPIQSQSYANRMDMGHYDFAHIGRIQRVKMNSNLPKEFKNRFQSAEKGVVNEKVQSSVVATSVPYSRCISPNLINLSPDIANIVRKGLVVNVYV